MITPFGVKENNYFDEYIQQSLTMEVLFKFWDYLLDYESLAAAMQQNRQAYQCANVDSFCADRHFLCKMMGDEKEQPTQNYKSWVG